ncbi:tRNA pseudouridine synthase B [Alphaproteobacteria bacterium]|nr:tRNA pseudouridine synthase B [Alphaproteobacteria bacterium]
MQDIAKMNGWLCLDKPAGTSSNAAMIKVRKILGCKTGYIGTLDPFATGVLPIAVGEARKFIHFLEDGLKEYEFTVVFGKTTDTLDKDGQVTEESTKIPTMDEIESVLKDFIGEQMQMPPVFSAIKISGRRACDRVRDGEQVELSPRKIHVFSLVLAARAFTPEESVSALQAHHVDLSRGNEAENVATFKLVCSKGTYVRSLARDIAAKVGALCYVNELRRTKSGFFSLKHAIPLENLLKIEDTTSLVGLLTPIESPLDDIPALYLDGNLVKKVQNGLPVPLKYPSSNVRICDSCDGGFRGIGFVSGDGLLKAVRMCVY